jgi:hypothetical protein
MANPFIVAGTWMVPSASPGRMRKANACSQQSLASRGAGFFLSASSLFWRSSGTNQHMLGDRLNRLGISLQVARDPA